MTESSKATHNHQNQSNDEIDLGRLFATLLDFKWWVIGATFAAAILGLVYGTLATPIYQADSLAQLEKTGGGFPGFGDLNEMFDNTSEAATEIEIIRSRMVLGTVVEQLRLDIVVQPKRFPLIGDFVARRYSGNEPNRASLFTSYAWGGEILSFGDLQLPEGLRGENLTFIAGDNRNFRLEFDGETLISGQTNQDIEQQTPYGRVQLRVSELRAREGTEFSVQQRGRLSAINSLRNNLSVSERGRQTGIIELRMTGANRTQVQASLNAITQEYLMQNVRRNAAEIEQSQEFVENQIPRLRQELQDAEDRLNQFRMANQSIDIQFDTQRVLQQMVEIDQQLYELSVREIELSRLYTQSHPNYRALIRQREELQAEREQLSKEVGELPESQQQILRLTRDVEVSQQVYLQMLNTNQEMNILRAGTIGNVRIIDDATLSPRPIAPRKALILALSIILGGMVGVGIAFVKGFLNRGIETPKDLEDVGISVYASIPLSDKQNAVEERIKRLTKRGGSQASKQKYNTMLLARDNPEELAVEALRSLRTSLHFAMLEAKNKVVMISGPSPEVGKTFVTSNLAVVLAQTGMKVLMIDADMRRGYVHTSFGIENTLGLADLLSEQTTKETAIQYGKIENLDVITRGSVPPNPSELLMHKNFAKLVEWANENYDIVLIDTPPILAVTDPAIVGHYAGTNLIVARFMRNPVKEVEFTIERFEKAGIEIKGVILNGIQKTARSSYGSGSYGYYSYGYDSVK